MAAVKAMLDKETPPTRSYSAPSRSYSRSYATCKQISHPAFLFRCTNHIGQIASRARRSSVSDDDDDDDDCCEEELCVASVDCDIECDDMKVPRARSSESKMECQSARVENKSISYSQVSRMLSKKKYASKDK